MTKLTHKHANAPVGMTVFFDTDVGALGGNPFKAETPFGFAVTVGIGNEFVRADHLEAERDALREALKTLLFTCEATTFSDQYPAECEAARQALGDE